MRSRVGYWPKVIRAEELLHSVQAEVSMYAEGEPYRAVGKFDPADGTSYVVHIELREEPPVRLPVLVGEVVFLLRSALDWA